VPIPFSSRHFEDDSAPFELKEEGFAWLDRVVGIGLNPGGRSWSAHVQVGAFDGTRPGRRPEGGPYMIIEARYNGPSGSGNGGWTCGLVASQVTGAAMVTLRVPPPLETELAVEVAGTAEAWTSVRLSAPDGSVVAEAVPARVDDGPVEPVGYQEAVAISAGYPGFQDHPFPTCFVCGPRRPEHDGLGLFPGRLDDGRTAAPWRVPADVTGPMVWASLDCPGGWAIDIQARPYVLGRLAARVDALPAPGDECVVMGELIRSEGRKAFVRTALYGPSGAVLAQADATWVAIS
jgi:hypothetical protein